MRHAYRNVGADRCGTCGEDYDHDQHVVPARSARVADLKEPVRSFLLAEKTWLDLQQTCQDYCNLDPWSEGYYCKHHSDAIREAWRQQNEAKVVLVKVVLP